MLARDAKLTVPDAVNHALFAASGHLLACLEEDRALDPSSSNRHNPADEGLLPRQPPLPCNTTTCIGTGLREDLCQLAHVVIQSCMAMVDLGMHQLLEAYDPRASSSSSRSLRLPAASEPFRVVAASCDTLAEPIKDGRVLGPALEQRAHYAFLEGLQLLAESDAPAATASEMLVPWCAALAAACTASATVRQVLNSDVTSSAVVSEKRQKGRQDGSLPPHHNGRVRGAPGNQSSRGGSSGSSRPEEGGRLRDGLCADLAKKVKGAESAQTALSAVTAAVWPNSGAQQQAG